MCERPADGQGHPACSVMVEGAFGRPLKQPLHGFRDGLLFIAPVVSRVNEKDSPPRSMAESHLTERKRMGIIAKWPFSRTDVLSSQYTCRQQEGDFRPGGWRECCIGSNTT